MIGAIVLAAGAASRFGGDKVVAAVQGTPLVRHVVDRLLAAGIAAPVVVTGAAGAAVAEALAGTGAVLVPNPAPADGLSGSLRVGLDALPPECTAFVVALGDQPLIDAALVRTLTETWRHSNAAAVVPEYRDGRGHPMLFDATLRERLRALTGDTGARDLLDRMGDRVLRVPVDAAMPRDVDTPDDLAALGG